MLEDAKCIVLEVLGDIDGPFSSNRRTEIENDIQRRLKRFFFKVIEKSPLIMPVIIPI